MSVKPIPDGYHTITPHLIVKGAESLMSFFDKAFAAERRMVFKDDDGRIVNAEVKIGDSIVMLAEATERYPAMPSAYYLYVTDNDATYTRALKAGATPLMEPADQFYGDRMSGVVDPSGNQWWIATHIEDVSPEEIQRRTEEWSAAAKQPA